MTGNEDTFRTRLRQEEAALKASGERSADERAPVKLDQQSVGRLSRMDALQVQAMAKAEQGRREARLLRVRSALARIEDGSFGDCLRCGEEIEPKRLESDPAATMCIHCARDG